MVCGLLNLSFDSIIGRFICNPQWIHLHLIRITVFCTLEYKICICMFLLTHSCSKCIKWARNGEAEFIHPHVRWNLVLNGCTEAVGEFNFGSYWQYKPRQDFRFSRRLVSVLIIYLFIYTLFSCCGPHPASCTMGTGSPSPGVKRCRGVTLTTHPHLVPRSKTSRSCTFSPPKLLRGV
jgi:hypothetical protein